jgi:hypothetical protein
LLLMDIMKNTQKYVEGLIRGNNLLNK